MCYTPAFILLLSLNGVHKGFFFDIFSYRFTLYLLIKGQVMRNKYDCKEILQNLKDQV